MTEENALSETDDRPEVHETAVPDPGEGPVNAPLARAGRRGCTSLNAAGELCAMPALAGADRCLVHSERTAAAVADARRRGGAATKRQTGLDVDVQAIDLSSIPNQRAVLESVVRALAVGAIGAASAAAITSAVRLAKELVEVEIHARLDELEKRIHEQQRVGWSR